jgi:hypothetical protein
MAFTAGDDALWKRWTRGTPSPRIIWLAVIVSVVGLVVAAAGAVAGLSVLASLGVRWTDIGR